MPDENKVNEIETPAEAAVEIAKEALNKNNWWKVTIWISIILLSLCVITVSFFKFGGLDVVKSIWGKSQTEIKK